MGFWTRLTGRLFGPAHESQPISELYAMLNESHARLKAEDYSGARDILLRAVEFRPRIKDALTTDWLLGALERTWLFQEQFDEQIVFFSDYLKRFPSDVSAHRAKGAALWYLGRLPEAITDYSRAVDLNPVDLLSRSGRGQILAEMGESAKATDDLDMALKLLQAAPRPTADSVEWCKRVEAFVRRGRAIAYGFQARIREAMNEFDASQTLSPENAWLYYSRAQVYDRISDERRALSDYQAALQKTKPRLTPIQKEHADRRVRQLGDAARE